MLITYVKVVFFYLSRFSVSIIIGVSQHTYKWIVIYLGRGFFLIYILYIIIQKFPTSSLPSIFLPRFSPSYLGRHKRG